MKPPAPEIIDMDVEQLEALLHRAEDASLPAEDLQTIRTVCESYLYLTHLIDQKSTTIARLRKLLFGAQTEKTSAVLGRDGEAPASSAEDASSGQTDGEQASTPAAGEQPSNTGEQAAAPSSSPRRPGHGRNGANDYPGAQRVAVGHEALQAGDACPECPKGTLYIHSAGVLLRFAARPPVQLTIYELQKHAMCLLKNPANRTAGPLEPQHQLPVIRYQAVGRGPRRPRATAAGRRVKWPVTLRSHRATIGKNPLNAERLHHALVDLSGRLFRDKFGGCFAQLRAGF